MYEDKVTLVLKTMQTSTEKKLSKAMGINTLFLIDTERAYSQGYIRAIAESINAIRLVTQTYLETIGADVIDDNTNTNETSSEGANEV